MLLEGLLYPSLMLFSYGLGARSESTKRVARTCLRACSSVPKDGFKSSCAFPRFYRDHKYTGSLEASSSGIMDILRNANISLDQSMESLIRNQKFKTFEEYKSDPLVQILFDHENDEEIKRNYDDYLLTKVNDMLIELKEENLSTIL